MDANHQPATVPDGATVADAASAAPRVVRRRGDARRSQTTPRRRRHAAAAFGAATVLMLATSACSDDAGPQDEPSPGTTMPYVDGTLEPLDSTGGPGGAVLNNQPTSPAVNNAPPGDDGTG